MSDTTETETETETDTTDEPSKAELHDRVQQLESTVEKLMPSRRDALKFGAAGIAGAAGLSAASGSADASTGSAGQIGDSSNRPDIFADTVDTNNLTGVSTGTDRQGCRVFLSSDQSISQNTTTKIQFDSEVYDSDNNFDTSSHNWTCPQTGLYAVQLSVRFSGGSDDEKRELNIGNNTDAFPSNQGAFSSQKSADTNDTISVTTVNKYQQGDNIVGYFRNANSNDTLRSGSGGEASFLEVAFLGGF